MIYQCMIDLHWFNTRELKMDMFWRINQCISILSLCVLNQWRSMSIDLTRTSSKWICFGYVWIRDVTILQFGYAAFMVELFYIRWSILDQSLHWDLFMRDIKLPIQSVPWTKKFLHIYIQVQITTYNGYFQNKVIRCPTYLNNLICSSSFQKHYFLYFYLCSIC